MKQYRISFIGAGKVAGSLSRQMYSSGCSIHKIVSVNRERGTSLAVVCNAVWSPEYEFVDNEDLIIAAVPDDQLKSVLLKVKCAASTIVAHTSGSNGLEVFPSQIQYKGVFYPLQTFSGNRITGFRDLPLIIEASDSFSSGLLCEIARLIGGKIHYMDTDQRKLLHVAAVFVCNFTNHMLTSGKLVAGKAGVPFEILEPLINETFRKAIESGPENSQTGPAFRNDKGTVKKHIDLLSFSPELKRIYREITRSIIRYYKST